MTTDDPSTRQYHWLKSSLKMLSQKTKPKPKYSLYPDASRGRLLSRNKTAIPKAEPDEMCGLLIPATLKTYPV